MGKLDEVSRVLGRLEGAIVEVKDDTRQIREHLKKINGNLAKNDAQTTKNSKDIEWMSKKSWMTGAGGGGILTALILIIKRLLGA